MHRDISISYHSFVLFSRPQGRIIFLLGTIVHPFFHSRSLYSLCNHTVPEPNRNPVDAAGIGPILGHNGMFTGLVRSFAGGLQCLLKSNVFLLRWRLCTHVSQGHLMRSSTFEDHFMMFVGTDPKIYTSKIVKPGQKDRKFLSKLKCTSSWQQISLRQILAWYWTEVGLTSAAAGSELVSIHYSDFIMSAMASLITDFSTVFSTVCSGADQRKNQSSALLAFARGIHRWPVNSPHKGPVTWKMVPFDDVVMVTRHPGYE